MILYSSTAAIFVIEAKIYTFLESSSNSENVINEEIIGFKFFYNLVKSASKLSACLAHIFGGHVGNHIWEPCCPGCSGAILKAIESHFE